LSIRRRIIETLSAFSAVVPAAVSVYLFALGREDFAPEIGWAGHGPLLLIIPFFIYWGLSGLTLFIPVALGASYQRACRYRLAWFVAANLCMAALYAFPWSSRQAFFRLSDRIHPGMTVTETEARLGGEHPVLVQCFDGRSGPSCRPIPPAITGTIYYVRRSERGDGYEKDRIIVDFKAGRIVSIGQFAD